MEILPLPMSGLFELHFVRHTDQRGYLQKVVHEPTYRARGLSSSFSEQFFSVSKKGVLRGMHFQWPPFDHDKLVYCVQGSVLDVVMDLRTSSKTYGQCLGLELSFAKANGLYIPKGFAHGFYCQTDEATLTYNVTTPHQPEADCGVLWSSIPFDWGAKNPVVSVRDQALIPWQDFVTPFV